MKTVAVLLVVVLAFAAVAEANKITNLPGLNYTLNFDQYSGYLPADSSGNRQIFYWFVESQRSPANDPVVLWLQGGPGCSGLIGLMVEHGPFRPNYDGGLSPNSESWNRIANVLYIEAPVGVGFSYQTNTSVYYNSDNQTAVENYYFLQQWYQLFPQFQSNSLWITGESFGGDYVPQLVNEIVDGADVALRNRLAGFMIGNPVFSCPAWKENELDVQIQLFYYHGLISYRDVQQWNKAGCATKSVSTECLKLYSEFYDAIGPLDSDNLYTDFCTGNATLDFSQRAPNCVSVEDLRNKYLNRPDVQAAIGARPTTWVECASSSYFKYATLWPDMLPYYLKFFSVAPQLRVLIYSGDVDIATCPHAYAQLCLSYLNQTLLHRWKPWTVDGTTAGYVETYDTYTYATVKGAGHEVPQYQPYFAFNMFQRFLQGTLSNEAPPKKTGRPHHRRFDVPF